ncbi:non-specific lipid-transfer protein 1-like [Vicia villosa]|uniref:non-specific lipid-transfer protein 1-like n=1 Tax=Vicia villosa TaxID=3911 RepID=UPI00273BB5B9|nr:non-specific lipid-transfer protein 1-like [Vicia villosa]
MASSMFVKLTFLAMACLVLGTPLVNGAVYCGQIQLTIAPCLGYLRNPSPAVPAPCCNGVRSINNQAKTIPDRQGACRCLKATATNLPGLNLPALAALPAKCGVNLPYKVSPSIDCNTVKN